MTETLRIDGSVLLYDAEDNDIELDGEFIVDSDGYAEFIPNGGWPAGLADRANCNFFDHVCDDYRVQDFLEFWDDYEESRESADWSRMKGLS